MKQGSTQARMLSKRSAEKQCMATGTGKRQDISMEASEAMKQGSREAMAQIRQDAGKVVRNLKQESQEARKQ